MEKSSLFSMERFGLVLPSKTLNKKRALVNFVLLRTRIFMSFRNSSLSLSLFLRLFCSIARVAQITTAFTASLTFSAHIRTFSRTNSKKASLLGTAPFVASIISLVALKL